MADPETITRDILVARYCNRQDCEPADLCTQLDQLTVRLAPVGFMLLECHMLDSSRMGELTILPYGGQAMYRDVPDWPISPRGLASDISVVIAVSPV